MFTKKFTIKTTEGQRTNGEITYRLKTKNTRNVFSDKIHRDGLNPLHLYNGHQYCYYFSTIPFRNEHTHTKRGRCLQNSVVKN